MGWRRNFKPRHPIYFKNTEMIRFNCKNQAHIAVKKGDMWVSIKFEPRLNLYYYDCTDEEIANQIKDYALFKSGKIWCEVLEEERGTRVELSDFVKPRLATKEAIGAGKEVVVGVASCSDARAFLRERFPDEDVMLRSKREILEYAERKNIHFSEL